jgi:hypothetical protein
LKLAKGWTAGATGSGVRQFIEAAATAAVAGFGVPGIHNTANLYWPIEVSIDDVWVDVENVPWMEDQPDEPGEYLMLHVRHTSVIPAASLGPIPEGFTWIPRISYNATVLGKTHSQGIRPPITR